MQYRVSGRNIDRWCNAFVRTPRCRDRISLETVPIAEISTCVISPVDITLPL